MLKYIRRSSTGVSINIESDVQKIPSPRGLPFVGTILSLMAAGSSSRLHKYIDERHKQLGPVFRESVGPVDAIFVSDPELMRKILTRFEGKHPTHVVPEPWTKYIERYGRKRGLFFMNGEEWLHYRRIMNKLLLAGDVESWIQPPITSVSDNLVKSWRNITENSITFKPNIEKELYRYALDVILAITLGSIYSGSKTRFEELLTKFSNEVHKIFLYSSRMYLFPASFYANLNLPAWRGFKTAVDEVMKLGDLLVKDIYKMDNMGDGFIAKMMQEGMEKDMIIRILIDFIIAAGDTTSFAIQWALYLLCSNPNVINDYRLEDTQEKRERLLKCIIKESMRLYPVAPFLTRFLPVDTDLNGCKLSAGSLLVLSIYTSGRDEKNFSNPSEFLPRRWEKNTDQIFNGNKDIAFRPYATMPFAIGSRSCIGRKIAIVEMSEILSRIMTNFDMKLMNAKKVEDEMQMVLKPKYPIEILFKSSSILN